MLEVTDIQGLQYIPNFITSEFESNLIAEIDKQPWLADLKRRTQHYGYKYDYRNRSIDNSMKIGALPDFAFGAVWHLLGRGLLLKEPDQLIINEYLPGQGIFAHVDCEPCFDDRIASISLGSGCMMELSKGEDKRNIYLERCSVLLLTGIARYEWKHGIPARKSDGDKARERRISLTFRNVIL